MRGNAAVTAIRRGGVLQAIPIADPWGTGVPTGATQNGGTGGSAAADVITNLARGGVLLAVGL